VLQFGPLSIKQRSNCLWLSDSAGTVSAECHVTTCMMIRQCTDYKVTGHWTGAMLSSVNDSQSVGENQLIDVCVGRTCCRSWPAVTSLKCV